MIYYILLLCAILLYFISFGGVCAAFSKRNVDPEAVLPWVILLTPLINTLYWLIFGVDWKGKVKNNENLKKLFSELTHD